jgi:uncharacterized protein (DUF983 family)
MSGLATENADMVFEPAHLEERPLGRSVKRGMLNTCPACGSGRLFGKFLKPVDHCASCNEELFHHRADDLPPYIVVVILGHVMLGGYMMTDLVFPASTWIHLMIWVPLSILIALLIIQPIKGGVIGLQWALRMHGFGGESDKLDSIDRT